MYTNSLEFGLQLFEIWRLLGNKQKHVRLDFPTKDDCSVKSAYTEVSNSGNFGRILEFFKLIGRSEFLSRRSSLLLEPSNDGSSITASSIFAGFT
uniref:Uncharacterized protein n=1 Tax=Meloidogyne incognita TaxID=6306 RepID=A0A914NBA2_MELIC